MCVGKSLKFRHAGGNGFGLNFWAKNDETPAYHRESHIALSDRLGFYYSVLCFVKL